MKQKMLSLLLSAAMLVSLTIVPAAAEETETGGHWAQGAADRWVQAGVIQGDADGDLRLDDSLTRGELATILVKTLGLTEKSENTYADLRGDEWYADAILQCTAAGIMKGDGVNCNATARISRQETTVMTARALGIEPEATPDLSAFQDGDQVADWAGGYISAMQKAQIIEGMGDGRVAPAADINRASMLTILDKAITTYIHEPGEYELTGSGIVIVRASGEVKLTGEFKGDVLVAQGAAGGTVTASGLKVDGAVKLEADSVALKADGLTATAVAVSGDNAAVEMKNSTVANVSVAGDSGKLSVTDTKVTGTITVADAKAEVNLGSGAKVEKIQATGDAAGAEINVAKGATVSTVTAESAVKIDNKGTVSKLEAKADDIVVDGNKPTKTEVDKGVDNPTDSKGNDVSKPSNGGGSSSGSSSGGSSHTHSYVDGVCAADSSIDPNAASVASEAELNAALAGDKTVIVLTGDISAAEQITVTRAVTINGNHKTLTAAKPSAQAPAEKSGLLVKSTKDAAVKILNLTVSGPNSNANKWDDGEYGIKVYDAANVTLKDVTVKAANAGIQVNSSTVTLGGAITLTGNEFGGIEVCKSADSGLPAGTLKLNGATVVCADSKIPAIWIDGVSGEAGTVEGAESLYTYNTGTQFYYFTSAEQATQTFATIGKVLYPTLPKALAAVKSNETILLTRDIVLETPTNYYTVNSFANATLDGQGHTITTTNTNWAALINTTTGTCVIKNLTMQYGSFIFPLVNQNSGHLTFEHVNLGIVRTDKTIKTDNNDSGFCCTNSAIGSYSNDTDVSLVFDSCVNYMNYTVGGSGYAAIFLGGMARSTHITFRNCTNNGDMSAIDAALFIGNPYEAGDVEHIKVEDCVNNGTLTGSKTAGYFSKHNNSSIFTALNTSVASQETGTGTINAAADKKTSLSVENGVYAITRNESGASRYLFQLRASAKSEDDSNWAIIIEKSMDSAGSTGLKPGMFIAETDFRSKFSSASLSDLEGVLVTGGILVGTYDNSGVTYYVFKDIKEGSKTYTFGTDGKAAAAVVNVYDSGNVIIDTATAPAYTPAETPVPAAQDPIESKRVDPESPAEDMPVEIPADLSPAESDA